MYIYKNFSFMAIIPVHEPTLFVDRVKAINNIELIAGKCIKSGTLFRPHFKTHQSHGIGRWFRDKGINCITVSSLSMARYFADDGWADILVAFPYNRLEAEGYNKLAQKIKLGITVSSAESAKIAADTLYTNVDVMIKIDTGYGRSGISWDDKEEIGETAQIINRCGNLNLRGLLTHSGHTYHAEGKAQIFDIADRSNEKMQSVRNMLANDKLIISCGDTPSASILETYDGIDEMRAGNFIFYDLMQYNLGTCSLNDISVSLACPVVDIQRNRNRFIIYGGAVHLSKDYILIDNNPVYGYILSFRNPDNTSTDISDKQIYIKSLSQEHGLIEPAGGIPEALEIGSIINIVPVHSCLTANLIGNYRLDTGEHFDHMNYKIKD